MANILPITAQGPGEIAREVARRARRRRLDQGLTQQGLADRAGVSLGSLKRFERTGQIAFVSLVRVAVVLGAVDELETWFSEPEYRSLDEALSRRRLRQRGSRT